MTWISLSFVATAHSPFEVFNDLGGGEGQAEVHAGRDDQRLTDGEGGGRDIGDGGHDLLDTDGVADGGFLDDGHEFIGDGRQNVLDGLGQHDELHGLPGGHAQAPGGLGLTAVDGLDAGADDLTEVGTGIQGQGDDAGNETLKPDESEELPGGQLQTQGRQENVVDDEQLDQQGGGTEDLNVSAGCPAQRVELCHAHQCQQQRQDKTEDNGEGGQGNGTDQAFQKHIPVSERGFKASCR